MHNEADVKLLERFHHRVAQKAVRIGNKRESFYRSKSQQQTGIGLSTLDHNLTANPGWPSETVAIRSPLVQPTAVNHVNLAGRVIRLIRCQIRRKIGDFIRFAQTSHRLSTNKLPAYLLLSPPRAGS